LQFTGERNFNKVKKTGMNKLSYIHSSGMKFFIREPDPEIADKLEEITGRYFDSDFSSKLRTCEITDSISEMFALQTDLLKVCKKYFAEIVDLFIYDWKNIKIGGVTPDFPLDGKPSKVLGDEMNERLANKITKTACKNESQKTISTHFILTKPTFSIN